MSSSEGEGVAEMAEVNLQSSFNYGEDPGSPSMQTRCNTAPTQDLSYVVPVLGESSTLAVDVPMEEKPEDEPVAQPTQGLGTMSGVFLPCLQNIFGVILFLRQPWITGQAGVFLTIGIVFACCLTTFCTSLSMSAIATNGRVPAGGTYYMISRTLGPEFGGAVGLSFYLGTTVAASMYILGAEETIRTGLGLVMPDITSKDGGIFSFQPIQIRAVGTGLVILVTTTVAVGVRFVALIGPWFLLAVILGILMSWIGILSSFAVEDIPVGMEWNATVNNFTNSTEEWNGIVNPFTNSSLVDNFWPDFDKGWGIAQMFGIFFPSVTGIMAGANRSASLTNPSRSIPKGTISAILITGTVYIINVLMFGAAATRTKLKNLDTIVCADVAIPAPIVVQIAVLLSTLGAGLQSMTGAPRLLQAICKDEVMPILNIFAEDPNKNPKKCLVVTFIIALAGILVGNLDAITPVVTMFFLMFYMFTNLACLVLRILKPPNFRPSFHHWSWLTALLGVILNLSIMFIISPAAASGAIVFAGLVYAYIWKFGKKHDWGDGLRGLKLQSVRKQLLELDGCGPFHHKNWCPHILYLAKVKYPATKDGETIMLEPSLMAFVKHLKKGEGLTVLGTVVLDDGEHGNLPILDIREGITTKVQEMRMHSFVEVVAALNLERGFSSLIQVAGIGRYQPNMVILGFPETWKEDPAKKQMFITALNLCERYGKACIVLRLKNYPQEKTLTRKRIDLWWKPHGGGLLILIPHLMTKHKVWENAHIQTYTLYQDEAKEEQVKNAVTSMFHELRFDSQVETVPFTKDFVTYSYPRTMMAEAGAQFLKGMGDQTTDKGLKAASASSAPTALGQESNGNQQTADKDKPTLNMETAELLNKIILQKSSDSDLVVFNLPRYKRGLDPDLFMEYVDCLTKNFPSYCMIRDSGWDVTTSFF